MTEHKWLKFAGFLNECTYGLDHEHCPFNKFRGLDQYQRLEHIRQIDNREAQQMMSICHNKKAECSPLVFVNRASEWSLAISI